MKTLTYVLGVVLFMGLPPHSAEHLQASEDSERIAKFALTVGLRGDTAKKDKLLAAVLEANPDSRLGNWAQGRVLVEDRWLDLESAEAVFQAAPKLASYLRRRDAMLHGKLSEWELANWCRSKGMTEEEQLHLTSVARNPKSLPTIKSLAINRLGLKNVGGILLSPAQQAELQSSIAKARKNHLRWSKPILQLLSRLQGKSQQQRKLAIERFRKDVDSGAISSMERLLSTNSQAAALTAVGFIEDLPEYDATASLVRHAVMSPWNPVRARAVEALQEREMADAVPLLLAELSTPVQSRFGVSVGADGMVRRVQQAYQEGRSAKVLHTDTTARGPHSVNVVQNVYNGNGRLVGQNHPDDVLVSRMIRQMGVTGADAVSVERTLRLQLALERRRILAEEVRKAQGVNHQLAMRNLAAAERNKRVIRALSKITQASVEPATPTAWWDWWSDENERYQLEKPSYTRFTSYSDPLQFQNVRAGANLGSPGNVGSHECFPAGTPVRTQLGPRDIEKIRVGDRVLSQDVETAELAYKIVVATTKRPPSDCVEIATASGTWSCTTGHMFWVNNHGWKMAKHLEAGEQLHSLNDSLTIERVTSKPQAIAYNLVVADFGTYFVTDQDILTHDNTERKPTRSIAPGVVRD